MKAVKLFACMFALFALMPSALGNMVDEEKEIYIVRPLITEPAWVQTGAYLKTFLVDLPNVVSRPYTQIGFVFTPGFTWSILDRVELNLGLPMIVNPDATGDREITAAENNPDLEKRDNWDTHPDFDQPGLIFGLKAKILGKKPEDRFFLAAGVLANIALPYDGEWATNFTQWKTGASEGFPYIISPYFTLAYNLGRFTPQLQLGMNWRMQERVDPATGMFLSDADGNPEIFQYFDAFFNLALPIAFPFEGTAPVLELNGVCNLSKDEKDKGGDPGCQVFITPAVTFLPKESPFSLGFACMIPILDSAFRKNEGFRFLVNIGYTLDFLGIPGPEDKEAGTGSAETPPAIF